MLLLLTALLADEARGAPLRGPSVVRTTDDGAGLADLRAWIAAHMTVQEGWSLFPASDFEPTLDTCDLEPLFHGIGVRPPPGVALDAPPGGFVSLRLKGTFQADRECEAASKPTPDWARDVLNGPQGPYACDGDLARVEGAGAHLYVIDMGVEADAPELGGRLESFDCSSRLDCAPLDPRWHYDSKRNLSYHGLKVASVAAASDTGLAPELQVSTYAVQARKALEPDALSVVCAMAAVARAARSRPDEHAVVNLSFAFDTTDLLSGPVQEELMESAVQRLEEYAIVVAAAGNDPSPKTCRFLPARVADLSVKSLDTDGTELLSSDVNACGTIGAPGRAVRVAPQACPALAVCSDNGTSFAAPLVSAVLAGAWRPGETKEQLLERLTREKSDGPVQSLRLLE